MSFTLKNYQRRVLAGLEEFLTECRLSDAATAYRKIAHRKDEDGRLENPYAAPEYKEIAGLEGRPHVCLRVPTGGGKTWLAALSLRPVARFMETETPLVLWFVPSDAIRRQTVDMLNNPDHPCRVEINDAFGRMTRVCDMEDFANLRPLDFTERACIIVSTTQMFRVSETTAKNPTGRMSKATRKIYATHEELEPHFEQFLPNQPPPQLERNEQGEVKRSFANLLFLLQPAVILDEAHGFVSDLSKTVLQRINPACVVEWTATPRERSSGDPLHNVLASVGAEELRDEEMIKLPVFVTSHTDWEKAVNGAVNEQMRLAKLATDSKDSVRPIVLYKAQNQNADVPVERLKKHLIDVEGVDEESIAIATGKTKELDSIDLLAPDCRIEHIITVEALREGWDCPFAYVLCTVDNMRSATSVEQLLGRVLRMPFARRRNHEELNRAYAHVSAEDFVEAVQGLRDQMAGGLGFEEAEVNWSVQENIPFQGENDESGTKEETIVFSLESKPDFSSLEESECAIAERAVRVTSNRPRAENGDSGVTITITKPIPPGVRDAIVNAAAVDDRKQMEFEIARVNKELIRRQSPVEKGEIFSPLTQLTLFLHETGEHVVVDKESLHLATEWNDLGDGILLQDFSIQEDSRNFAITLKGRQLVYRQQERYQVPILSYKEFPMEKTHLAAWLEREIRNPDGIYFTETLKKLVGKNIDAQMDSGIRLEQLVRAKYALAMALKQWLKKHAMRKIQETRKRILFDDNEDLGCESEFSFTPNGYDPGGDVYDGDYVFEKHYYKDIGKFDGVPGGEEETCAIHLDRLPEVRYWVRNVPRKRNSFALPRSSSESFYPDFVAELTNGKILVVEYKGADRWENSKLHRQIGKLWEIRSKGRNFFLMVSKRDGKPGIDVQLRNKVNEIFAAN